MHRNAGVSDERQSALYMGMNHLFIQSILFDWNKISENSYLRNIAAINGLEYISFNSNITFFVGENGSGKSTLLEAIAVAYGFNPEGGTRNYNFSTYDSHSELWGAIRLSKGVYKAKSGYFLRAESFYNVATKEEDYVDIMHPSQRYHEKSHGESFLEIYRCAKGGAQFIIATHSPILLGIPDAEIYSFDSGKVHLCGYEETESYQVTEMFINNREQMLKHLLGDQEAIMPPEDHERIRRNQNS